jgi:glucose dehydrogenase
MNWVTSLITKNFANIAPWFPCEKESCMDQRKPSHRGVSLAWSTALLTIFFTLMSLALDARRGVLAQAGQGEGQLGARVQEDILQRQTDDRQWAMPARNYASTRYSGLDQITTENVKNLQLAWTFSTGVLRGHEAAPYGAGSPTTPNSI